LFTLCVRFLSHKSLLLAYHESEGAATRREIPQRCGDWALVRGRTARLSLAWRPRRWRKEVRYTNTLSHSKVRSRTFE
jgi:hypothetical protein